MKVKLLSEETILKIAAGEVVERPASVAKELVENAIDAGAQTILVEAFGGGLEKIVVGDDGEGMSPDDLAMAIHRHSTSKINDSDDLFSVTSMGFRGEALASIGAIAKMTITTGRPRDTGGSTITVIGGKVGEVKPAANPNGTRIVVEELFFNTPVRKKFMRKQASEFSALAEIVQQYILARPGISFKLLHNQKTMLSSPGTGSLKDAIASLLGLDIADNLIECRGSNNGYAISGYIVGPNIHRGNREMQFFTVNGRPVNLRLAGSALEKAFHTLLPSQRYPLAFLNIEAPPKNVDINVHPTKRQLKFSDAGSIFTLVYHSCQEALKPILELPFRPYEGSSLSKGYSAPPNGHRSYRQDHLSSAFTDTALESHELIQEAFPLQAAIAANETGYTILGQVFSTYIVVAVPGELRLVDQHAAQERVLYEEYLRLFSEGKKVGQVIIPIETPLNGHIRHFVEVWLPQLSELGFKISLTDEGMIVREVPMVFKKILSMEDVLEIVAILQEQQAGQYSLKDYKQAALMLMACKGAIKANQRLSAGESLQLLSSLEACDNSRTCPHGRPTWIAFSKNDLEKLFARR